MAKKIILDIDEELWKEVGHYKLDSTAKNMNEAVVQLIKKGLKSK